ncbi:hypothetical protein TgHK011_001334 [Trichoderma gracile]|nr:hypothetical protein TgHK011_001334 [Trichoderma gracile]
MPSYLTAASIAVVVSQAVSPARSRTDIKAADRETRSSGVLPSRMQCVEQGDLPHQRNQTRPSPSVASPVGLAPSMRSNALGLVHISATGHG